MTNFGKKLQIFMENSKTAYHAVANITAALDSEGFTRLYEGDEWDLAIGGKYYVVRAGSSVIAFVNNGGGFMIGAAHSDSPAFRVKGDSTLGACVKLDTEKYGGMINYTWLDRPLTVSGRVTVKTEGGVESRLADIGGEIDRRFCSEIGATNSAKQHHYCQQNHQYRGDNASLNGQ